MVQDNQIAHNDIPDFDTEQMSWFALSAPYRNEKRAKCLLESKGIKTFLPMRYEIVKNRYGGKSKELVPAVSNLLFAYSTQEGLQQVKTGVKYLQYKVRPERGKNVPIIVPDNQMEQFITICKNYNEQLSYFTAEEIDLKAGQRIKVIGGEFDGLEGYFVKIKGKRNKRIVVHLPDLVSVALTEINDGLIEAIQ